MEAVTAESTTSKSAVGTVATASKATPIVKLRTQRKLAMEAATAASTTSKSAAGTVVTVLNSIVDTPIATLSIIIGLVMVIVTAVSTIQPSAVTMVGTARNSIASIRIVMSIFQIGSTTASAISGAATTLPSADTMGETVFSKDS